jgi:hypothetical protein
MGIGDAAHLAANSLDQLGTALSYLRPDRSGYITAEDYERITGEELDEFSTKGRQMMMIARLAAEHRCTIKVPPIERRVYFTKSK